jgi:hypothetical protein
VVIENWRACKRRYLGQHPWRVRVFEISTASEGAGAGAVVLFQKDALGPQSPVPAFFALAGGWRRQAGEGWVDATGAPARKSDEEVRAAWDDLRQLFEKGNFDFADAPAAKMHEELARALSILGERAYDPNDTRYVARLGPMKSWGGGHIYVDGQATSSRAIALPVQPPFVRCVRICAEWNDKWFLGETPTQWVLVHWHTNA